MSEKIINLGKVKGRTLELKVEDKIIKKKYDDETEWQPLVDLSETSSSIETVSDYSELPEDASENDVAIVEEEEYIRTENKTVVLPIEVKLNAEDQYVPNIYNINFRDSFNSILNNEEVKSLGSVLNIRLETETRDIMYVDIGVEIAPMMAGVDHPVQVVAVMNSDEDMNFYVSGISIRDFLQLMMELELEEEQWVILLGSHANDNSADSPSYGWVNMVMSTEPINDNSLGMDGVYATLLFNSEAPKITDILSYASVGIMNTSGESIDASASLYSTYDSSSDVDPEEQAFVLKFVNLALNNIAHGGIIEQSNDIYNPKGLFQNDNGEWVSLEEKMNTPRFVDTYADLPKTSIENGIMAVAKESVYETEPTETTVLEIYKSYRLKSIDDITSETINNIIETLLPSYPTNAPVMTYLYLINMNENNEIYCQIVKNIIDENNIIAGITFSYNINNNITRQMVYFTEIPFGTRVEDMEIFPPAQGSDTYPDITLETGKWYWGDVYDDGKDEYYTVDGIIHEGFPIDEFPNNVLFGGGGIEFDNSVYPAVVETYESSDNNYKGFTTLDTIAFHFDDLNSISTITYPAGFYRYNNNEWKHVEDVSGGNFENEDVLRAITATDIGNIQENTEKRHEHSNKSYLDQIQWDTLDKINNQVPQNTQARHTHENKEIIDNITQNHLDEISKISEIKESVENIKPGFSNYTVRYLDNSYENFDENSTDNINRIDIGNISNSSEVKIKISKVIKNTKYPYNEKIFYFNCIEEKPIIFECKKYSSYGYTRFPFEGQVPRFRPGNQYKATCSVVNDSYRIKIELVTINNPSDSYDYFNENNEFYLDYFRSDLNFKYGKVTQGEINFAPSYFVTEDANDGGNRFYTFNQTKEYYFEKGYKEIIGEDPLLYAMEKNMNPNNNYELRFKELDEHILLYWIITPKNSYLGDYINTSYLTNFANFYSFDLESEIITPTAFLGEFDTSNATSMQGMFQGCINLKEGPLLNTKLVISMQQMFLGCRSLISIPAYDTENLTNASYMFYDCDNLTQIPTFKTEQLYNTQHMFSLCRSLQEIPDFPTTKIDNCEYMFSGCTSLIKSPKIDTSHAVYLAGMYSGCINLEEIPELDLTAFSHYSGSANWPNSFLGIFNDCTSLITIGKVIIPNGGFHSIRYFFENAAIPSLQNITLEANGKLGYNWDGLSKYPNLTADSIVSFINALEDNTGEEEQYTLTIGATNLERMSPEQILIATNKNILLA